MQKGNFVYSQEVIDEVTIAVQVCKMLENLVGMEKADFVGKMIKLLPMLYVKTLMLSADDSETDMYLQTFVNEDDYSYVESGVAELLGADNAYLEVFVDGMRYSDTPITSFISENLADVYQELKDMLGNFQTENEEVMHSALCAMKASFVEHWGQKLLNALRALHSIYFNLDENDDNL